MCRLRPSINERRFIESVPNYHLSVCLSSCACEQEVTCACTYVRAFVCVYVSADVVGTHPVSGHHSEAPELISHVVIKDVSDDVT